MSTLLVEIGTEELPYKVCESVIRQLEGTPGSPGLALSLLGEQRLLEEGAAARVLVSPRRIAVLVDGVPEVQVAQVQKFRGPKAEIAYAEDGTLTKAGAGFARSKGAAAEDVRREVVDGTEFVVVSVEADRRAAREVVPELVARLITGLQIPRGMRWGARPEGASDYLRFSRPIRWLVAKLGDETLRGEFYGLPLGDVSQGHRVLGAPVTLASAGDYERLLEEQKVVVSQAERRRRITEGLDATAEELGGSWSDPGDVLAEAVYLAEWPSVARGGFKERHLRLPAEVLVTAMQSHQRYFPVTDADGGLLPAFLYVSNGAPEAAPLVTRGNERVLDGRLDDAEFAYDRDLAEGLPAMADRLGAVVFHEKLGSLADKAGRLGGLVAALASGQAGAAGAAGNGSGDSMADTLRTVGPAGEGRPRQPGRHRVPRAAGHDGRALRRGRRPRRRGGPRRRRALPAALRDGAAAGHRRRRAARRRRQARQHRRRLGGRREALRLARPLRAAPRGHGHRAHRAGVRPALPARRSAGARPSTSSSCRAPPVWTTPAAPPSSPRPRRSCASACRCSCSTRACRSRAWRPPWARRPATCRPWPHAPARSRPWPAGNPSRMPSSPTTGARRWRPRTRTPGHAPSTRPSSPTTPSVSSPRPMRLRAGRCLDSLDNLELESAVGFAAGLRPAVDRYFEAVLVMDPDEAVRANRLAQLAAVTGLIGRIGEFSRLPLAQA